MPEKCRVCGERLWGGSHWHCSCGTPDETGQYGHHGTWCNVTGTRRTFHHCGPDGDCELEKKVVT